MDFYSASGLSLLWICFFETVAVSWFYGVRRFSSNIEDMMGPPSNWFQMLLSWFWIACWAVLAPLVMGVSTKLLVFENRVFFLIENRVKPDQSLSEFVDMDCSQNAVKKVFKKLQKICQFHR